MMRWMYRALALFALCCTGELHMETDGAMPVDRDGGRRADGGTAPRTDGGDDERDAGPIRPPERSAGCGNEGAPTGVRTVDAGGRQTLVYVPASYDADVAHAIVIGFHGGGGNGEGFRAGSGAIEAEMDGAIFVYPSGPDGVWNAEVYDGNFDFLRATLEVLFEDYCVDTEAVFAFGFSWGGWAVTQLACSAPELVAGVAAIAGGGPMGGCGDRVGVMLIHGTMDNAELIGSSEASLAHFRGTNGCGSSEAPFDPDPCVGYDGCGEPVVWCRHEGGHEVPGFAPRAMWNFFQDLR
jgi:polyhydroxybutyrate depolymerase